MVSDEDLLSYKEEAEEKLKKLTGLKKGLPKVNKLGLHGKRPMMQRNRRARVSRQKQRIKGQKKHYRDMIKKIDTELDKETQDGFFTTQSVSEPEFKFFKLPKQKKGRKLFRI